VGKGGRTGAKGGEEESGHGCAQRVGRKFRLGLLMKLSMMQTSRWWKIKRLRQGCKGAKEHWCNKGTGRRWWRMELRQNRRPEIIFVGGGDWGGGMTAMYGEKDRRSF